MLQEYLNQGLLLLSDDNHFDKLKKTATELAKKQLKNKHKILSYTKSVLDNTASLDNQDIAEVKDIISKSWNTFLSNVKDTPVTFIKVVILEALKEVANDIDNAAIIWYASRNILQYYSVSEKELGIIRPFILNLGDRVESAAVSEWAIEPVQFPEKFLRNFTFSGIDKAKLEAQLIAAAGGQGYGGENPVAVNDISTWHNFFSKRAAQGIADETLVSVKSVANKLVNNDGVLADFVIGLQHNLEASRLRSQLLWWKESSYSPSLKIGYEEATEGIKPSLLSFDYASYLPQICPLSAEYFLKRMYTLVASDREVTLSEFFELIDQHSKELKQLYNAPTTDFPKTTLLEFLQALVWKRVQKDDFEPIMGIPSGTPIQLRNLTLWLFHDQQIAKLIAIKK